MDEFSKLFEFIDLAEKNRKYPANTAQGKRAALKLYETVITADERKSLSLIEERIKEIHLNLISKYKETFNIQSLNTYRGRFLQTVKDYKRYGRHPEAIAQWETKNRTYTVKNAKSHEKDTAKDTSLHNISLDTHTGVHKLEVLLEHGGNCLLQVPPTISKKDAQKIKDVLDALAG